MTVVYSYELSTTWFSVTKECQDATIDVMLQRRCWATFVVISGVLTRDGGTQEPGPWKATTTPQGAHRGATRLPSDRQRHTSKESSAYVATAVAQLLNKWVPWAKPIFDPMNCLADPFRPNLRVAYQRKRQCPTCSPINTK